MAVPAESKWFEEHVDAAHQIAGFLKEAGVQLEGRRVADVGCGDGIIDLALSRHAAPDQLVGFDVNPTDLERLGRLAGEFSGDAALPSRLSFRTSEPRRLPADDATFDVVISWSAFEHIGDPVSVLAEMRRVLAPHGVLFIQLWPFYYSEHGAHLWAWYPEGFVQLRTSFDEIAAGVRADPKGDAGWADYMLEEVRTLNRLTLDELQRCLLATGFEIAKAQAETNAVVLTPELARYPLSDLLLAGIKLLARPRR